MLGTQWRNLGSAALACLSRAATLGDCSNQMYTRVRTQEYYRKDS